MIQIKIAYYFGVEKSRKIRLKTLKNYQKYPIKDRENAKFTVFFIEKWGKKCVKTLKNL